MYNQNGKFLPWNEAGIASALGVPIAKRTLHVCYSGMNPPLRENFPGAGTSLDVRTDCTPPPQTCEQNDQAINSSGGVIAAAVCNASTWTTPPRPLSQCAHEIGRDAPCGETPQWFGSAPRRNLNPAPGQLDETRYPIVFVQENPPSQFKLVGRLSGAWCINETNPEWAGSDELTVALFSSDAQATKGAGASWEGDGFNSYPNHYPRTIDPKKVMSVIGLLPQSESQSYYGMALTERDGGLLSDIVGYTASVALGVAAGLGAGLAGGPWVGVGAGAIVTTTSIAIYRDIRRNDPLGSSAFHGSPEEFFQRYAVSHDPGFVENAAPGPLVAQVEGNNGTQKHKLLFPNILRHPGGTMSRALDPRLTDNGTDPDSRINGRLRGFREIRRISVGGAEYGIFFLWQWVKCDSGINCVDANPDPTKP